MELHRETRTTGPSLLAWWLALAVLVIVFALMLVFRVVLVDRLTLHNATTSPLVFTGARGETGSRSEADIYIDACDSADFEWGSIGWAARDADAYEPIQDAVRVEMTIRPPSDGVAGARYVAIATDDGVHEAEDGELLPSCPD